MLDSSWCLVSLSGKLPFEGLILAINIPEKVHLAVAHDYSGYVHQHDLNRALDLDGNRFRPLHRFNHAIPRPAGLAAQDPVRQIFRIFYANAAVAEIAALPIKEPPCR